jgi:hypothetical protein
MAMKVPMGGLESGVDVRWTSVSKEIEINMALCTRCRNPCARHRLAQPKRVAMARDTAMTPILSLPVDDDVLALGQDATYGTGRPAPGGWSLGEDEATLRSRMLRLLDLFAARDPDGKARRLMEAFLSKKSDVEVFTDPDLDRAVEAHDHLAAFARGTLKAPVARMKKHETVTDAALDAEVSFYEAKRLYGAPADDEAASKIRLHQVLAKADWDIDAIRPVTDLAILAFNKGSKLASTGDFDNGLGLMINGEQYAFVYAEDYEYVSCKARYDISLKFVLYDVFGLDDVDLVRFGAANSWSTAAQPGQVNWWEPYTPALRTAGQQGITAWWQLQHQFGYAPLLTKAVARKAFAVSTQHV